MVDDMEIFPSGTIDGKPVVVIACDLSNLYDDLGNLVGWAHTPVGDGKIAVDPKLGRIAFSSSLNIATASIRTTFFCGFSANMGGGEYARGESFSDLSEEGYDLKPVTVTKGTGLVDDQNLIEDALASLGTKGGVIEIGGNDRGDEERYDLDAIVVDATGKKRIEIRAAEGFRPLLVLKEDMEIQGDGGSVSLNGLVISGRGIRASAGLERLSISHCTLVPGLGPGQTDMSSPSLVVESVGRASGIDVEIENSIVGPLKMPAEGVRLIIRDSIVDSPSSGSGARIFPSLQSGLIQSFPLRLGRPNVGPFAMRDRSFFRSTTNSMLYITPIMKVTIAGQGPHRAVLSKVPSDLKEARAAVEDAIRSAHDSPGFKGAGVISINEMLIIIPGVPGDVVIEDDGTSGTASKLKLDFRSSRKTEVLMGGPLKKDLSLSSPFPAMTVYKEGGGVHTVSFESSKKPLEIAAGIQASLQAIPEYKGTVVTYLDDRLVVISPDDDILPIFGPSPSDGSAGDSTTYRELGLKRDVPAISSLEGRPGAELLIERSTVLGMANIKSLKLASESIFADLLFVDQRQEGCVRKSFVPRGSRTPRMFECPARKDAWTEGLRFTSTRYGDPGYCQLSQLCASEIRESDGRAELGVFHDLYQPQRETNMWVRLSEHLKLGIDFGTFYST
jgi:hypothetical protein